jgi:multidrug efflux system membrane fusion protein
MQAVLVTTGEVVEKPVPVEIKVIGGVEAYSSVGVKAQVSGQLMKVYFSRGAEVKAGDLLFLIDPRPFDEAIRQAEAALARNTALLRQAEANLRRDTAQEKYARDQAGRYQKLFAEGVMSRQQAEQYTLTAESSAEAMRADQAAIESYQAAVKADTASLANAKLQRSYCEIRSPLNGRAGDLLAEEGALVRTSDSALVMINQVHPVYVSFAVPQNRLAEVRRQMASGPLTVLANAPGDIDKPENGRLTFIDNAVDPSTGTIKLKATFDNPASRLWPGQFVNVILRLRTIPSAVVAASRAIQMGQDGEFAYVVKADDSVEMRPVTVGLRMGEELIIDKGLRKGETIVVEGQLRLAPGMKIRRKGGIRK